MATGYTGAMPPVHPDKAAGPGWRKPQYHRIHRWPYDKHRSIHKSFTREHVTRVKNFSTSPDTPMAWKHAPVHSHSHGSEAMQLYLNETLLHRIYRWPKGACTGASLTDCALIQMSTATIWIQCDRIHRCYGFGLSGACDFCAVCSQWLGVPLHYI